MKYLAAVYIVLLGCVTSPKPASVSLETEQALQEIAATAEHANEERLFKERMALLQSEIDALKKEQGIAPE